MSYTGPSGDTLTMTIGCELHGKLGCTLCTPVLLDDNYRLIDRVRTAPDQAALSRLWTEHQAVWTPEHTAAGQARLAQLAGGAR